MALAGIALVGCTKTEEGAGTGAFLGALAGQAIGGDTESTLIGAGVGALVGGAIGNDQQKQQDQAVRNAQGSTVRRTVITEELDSDGNVVKTGRTTTESTQTTGGYTGLDD